MFDQNNSISGTPIRDNVLNKQIGWTGPAGSVQNMYGTQGYIDSYRNTYRTFSNGRFYENQIDNFGNVRTPLGDTVFRIG